MPNKGAVQLAGAIAYGIWDGIMLPEGAKGLSEVLHDWVVHSGEKTNNPAAALTLIEMVWYIVRCVMLLYYVGSHASNHHLKHYLRC